MSWEVWPDTHCPPEPVRTGRSSSTDGPQEAPSGSGGSTRPRGIQESEAERPRCTFQLWVLELAFSTCRNPGVGGAGNGVHGTLGRGQ